jgi:hypothetical protein
MWERNLKTISKNAILKNKNIEKSRISAIKYCMAFKRSGVRLPSAPLVFSRVSKS